MITRVTDPGEHDLRVDADDDDEISQDDREIARPTRDQRRPQFLDVTVMISTQLPHTHTHTHTLNVTSY